MGLISCEEKYDRIRRLNKADIRLPRYDLLIVPYERSIHFHRLKNWFRKLVSDDVFFLAPEGLPKLSRDFCNCFKKFWNFKFDCSIFFNNLNSPSKAGVSSAF